MALTRPESETREMGKVVQRKETNSVVRRMKDLDPFEEGQLLG
jgi:hypothetical protein